jgi:glycosyltransferase involved in cell wall biosynthesis
VANQDYPNIEHIVVDGGSTDGSVDILERWDHRLSYWVSEKDKGQTHAINKGLSQSTGDLIGFQNSDDVYLPGAFQRIVECAKRNPEVGLIYGDFLHIDEHDQVLDEQLLGTASLWIQASLGPQIHNQAAFWRREVQERIGLLDENYRFDMDYEFFSRALAAGFKARHVSSFLGAFRHHSASKTSNLQEVSREELQQVGALYWRKTRARAFPRPVARQLAKAYKALRHVLQGRADYLVRSRLKFKKR